MNDRIIAQARANGIEPAALAAFIAAETGGQGFNPATGKITIQFEPSWFRKNAPYAPSGAWSLNGVERQAAEWLAFNDAFSKDPTAALESTSIGIGQIMGLHFKRVGFKNPGKMWDDAKKGIENQIGQLCKFVNSDPILRAALAAHDWDLVAKRYNGYGYKALAIELKRTPYDQTLALEYRKALNTLAA